MLLTVEGEVVVRDIVNLLKVQGIYGSLGRDVMLQKLQRGKGSVGRNVMLHTLQGGNGSFG